METTNQVADTATPSPLAQDTDHRIRWFGEFNSPLWEQQYRIYELPEGIKLARAFVGVAVAAFLAFLVNDYHFFGATAMFGWMLALRGLIIFSAILAMLLIHYGMSPQKFDRIVITWTMMTKIVMLIVVATRPAAFVGHTIVTVSSILLTYWIVPIPLVWRALTAWFMTTGVLILGLWVNPWPDSSTKVAVTLALVIANVIGGEMCREQQISRRRQYLALWLQQELSASLERALSEIKTLEGILPICMHCKRISDEKGSWEPVEDYVRKHSDADFSHGLCPECARSHYPEIDWEEAGRQRRQRALINPPRG